MPSGTERSALSSLSTGTPSAPSTSTAAAWAASSAATNGLPSSLIRVPPTSRARATAVSTRVAASAARWANRTSSAAHSGGGGTATHRSLARCRTRSQPQSAAAARTSGWSRGTPARRTTTASAVASSAHRRRSSTTWPSVPISTRASGSTIAGASAGRERPSASATAPRSERVAVRSAAVAGVTPPVSATSGTGPYRDAGPAGSAQFEPAQRLGGQLVAGLGTEPELLDGAVEVAAVGQQHGQVVVAVRRRRRRCRRGRPPRRPRRRRISSGRSCRAAARPRLAAAWRPARAPKRASAPRPLSRSRCARSVRAAGKWSAPARRSGLQRRVQGGAPAPAGDDGGGLLVAHRRDLQRDVHGLRRRSPCSRSRKASCRPPSRSPASTAPR